MKLQRSATVISDQPTMAPHKPTVGIVSLNWHQIMGQAIAECARKIEPIGSYSCDCWHER